MLKFLVTGAAGQLGKDVVRELENRGYEVTGSGSKKRKTTGRYVKMDITDRNEVEAVMKKLRPDIVIHCAAWTAVDAAEEPENYEKVWEVNGKGTANLASACQKIHAKMVYISTDYVFGGQGSRPWEPDCEEFSPLNRYGETKLQGEQAVKAELKEYFILQDLLCKSAFQSDHIPLEVLSVFSPAPAWSSRNYSRFSRIPRRSAQ